MKIIIRSGAKAHAHEKKQTPSLPHWDCTPCDTWHKKYTFSHYNTIKETGHKPKPKRLSVKKKKKKKADLVSVCCDGEQTRWVNRLQCVRLLFLCCITATPQPDELATLPERVPPRAKLCWEWLHRDIPHMAADSHWDYAEAWVCCSIM